MIEKGFW